MNSAVLESPPPTYSAAGSLRQLLIRHSTDLGVPREKLRAAFGDAEAPCERVPIAEVRRLWRVGAELSGVPAFGLCVAERMPVGELDLLDYLVRSSSALGEALARLVRFAPLVADAGRFSLELGKHDVKLRHHAEHGVHEFSEFAWGMTLLRGREFSGVPLRPTAVRFMQQKQPLAAFDRVFQAPVTFDAPFDEIVFDRALLDIPFKTAEPRLCSILEGAGEAMLRKLAAFRADSAEQVSRLAEEEEPRDAGSSVSALARIALIACLQEGNPNIDRVAERLGLSARSLQRHLRSENTSHRQLLEQARAELVHRFQGSPGVSRSELARVLAYSCTRSVDRRQRASSSR
jgi:AraC-like DNA-binding protein